MRKTPTYDWGWLESHAPFKKILEDMCELEVEKEIIPYRVFGNMWSKRNEYYIKLNYPMLQDNFEETKKRILNTRICKHNKEIFDYVNEVECSKKDISYLIIIGCISYCEGSFKWNWCED